MTPKEARLLVGHSTDPEWMRQQLKAEMAPRKPPPRRGWMPTRINSMPSFVDPDFDEDR